MVGGTRLDVAWARWAFAVLVRIRMDVAWGELEMGYICEFKK